MLRSLFAAVLALTPVLVQAQTPELKVNPNTGETQEQFAKRTKWWREAKFGMFIHWGLYAVPADSTDRNGNKGAGEWYFSNKQAQVKDYEKFAAQFNPVKFDADKWVKTAKDAGMKYIVITSKHHDGFCMFDSKLTDYCITKATPYKHDPMRDLAAACRKYGLTFCFYHSIMDWHHPDYLPRRPWEGANRPADGANLDRYIAYMQGQLNELLTNYGPIGGIWFDGGWEHNAQELHSLETSKIIHLLQPGALVNDRNQLPEDYSTPEQTIPANALPGGRLWETCMTLNDTWGYAKNDNDWKPADDLIRKLCDIASKGGNFLLNVGPTAEGEFTPETLDRLATVGKWMKVNSKSIYATTKSPFRKLPFDGRCTRKGNTLYLQVFHWPQSGLKLTGLKTPVTSAHALDGGETLVLTAGSDGIAIAKPRKLDPVATVVELKLAGAPVVDEVTPAILPQSDGSLVLNARDADIHGETAQYEQGNGKDNIGYWTNASDFVTWTLDVPKAGNYSVEITYACPSDTAGSTFDLALEKGGGLSGIVQGTGMDWGAFKAISLGTLSVAQPGKQTLSVRVRAMPHGAVMNLQRITLKPEN